MKKNKKTIFILFAIAVCLAAIGALTAERYLNNFIIFTSSADHFFNQKPLYNLYPIEHHDYFLYGPVFTIIIAPFSMIPIAISKTLWVLFNLGIYLFAIYKLFKRNLNYYYWWIAICFQDIYLSGLSYEINNLMVAIIILCYVYIQRKKEIIAGLLSGLFAMIKLFPIMALLFLSFKGNKNKFTIGFIAGIALAVLLPILFTNSNYIFDQLYEWKNVLIHKDELNRSLNPMVDYSLPGMFRKNLHSPNISNFPFLIFGFVCLLGLFIINWFRHNLKLDLLVLSILTILVFNSNTESPSFIISSTAVAIWWNLVENKKTKTSYFLLIIYFLFSVLPTIDGYPKVFKDHYLHELGFRAFPPTLIWFYIVFKAYLKNSFSRLIYK
jgi:Glycosyltransferase family 87